MGFRTDINGETLDRIWDMGQENLPPEKRRYSPRYLRKAEEELYPEKRGWLPSWIEPIARTVAPFHTAVGGLLAGEKLFTKPTERLFTKPTGSYRKRAEKIISDLQNKGYNEEGIQKVLDILASVYGKEPAKAIGGPQIRVDMRKILEEQGETTTSEKMAEMLRGLGYSDDEIRKAGVRL